MKKHIIIAGVPRAGKSTVSDLLAAHGLPVINADRVYHQLLIPPSPCLDELVRHFGRTILADDGTLNRRALGEIVFSSPAALDNLNTIAHRYVMEEIRLQLDALRRQKLRAAVLDAPQLFEAGANRDCGVIISVLADANLRLERIVARDGIDADLAYRRIAAQKKDEFFRSHSDYIIENNGEASFDPDVLAQLEEEENSMLRVKKRGGGSSDDDMGRDKKPDPLLINAIEIAVENQSISTSSLQRYLEVGYSRGAKLIDSMERLGIVGPPNGAKPREVLMTMEQYHVWRLEQNFD